MPEKLKETRVGPLERLYVGADTVNLQVYRQPRPTNAPRISLYRNRTFLSAVTKVRTAEFTEENATLLASVNRMVLRRPQRLQDGVFPAIRG